MNLGKMVKKCIDAVNVTGKSFKVVKTCYEILVVVPFDQDVEGITLYYKEVI